MARRYTRDNRGRFSSTGATARGGRLATAAGNKRATVTTRISSGKPGGMVAKPKGLKPQAATKLSPPPKGSLAANKIEMAKGRSAVLSKQKDSLNKRLKAVNAQIKEAGPNAAAHRLEKLQIQSRLSETRLALGQSKAAARGDTASVNRPMAGARGKALNAEISRNVAQQKATARTADKARNRQFKAEQSRAKKLRETHVDALAKGYASRNPGRTAAEVKRRIGAMEPRDQIKLFKQYVKENRGTAAKPAAAKPAAKPAAQAKAARDIAAAQRRLKTKQYGDTASQGQALMIDRRLASMTPSQLGASRVRSARAMVQRKQRSLKDPINASAPASWRSRMEQGLADSRREFRAAAADYRLIKPRRPRK